MNNRYNNIQMKDRQKVKVLLASDERWYSGIVIKARKEWVELSDYYYPFIADESNIVEWRLDE